MLAKEPLAAPAPHTHLPRPGTLTQQLTSERRIVTILFADIVGSTALAELLDPEEWTEIAVNAVEYEIDIRDSVFTLSNLRNPRD